MTRLGAQTLDRGAGIIVVLGDHHGALADGMDDAVGGPRNVERGVLEFASELLKTAAPRSATDDSQLTSRRMKVCWVVFVAMVGCGFPRPSDLNSATPDVDASAVDAPAAPVCFGAIVPICFPASAVPSAPRTLFTVGIDTDLTDADSLCDQNNDQRLAYCVVAGAGVSLPAGETVTAHGSKPLVLLSTAAMHLLGSIDVSSHLNGGAQPRGAGANPADLTACVFATHAMAPTMGGGGTGASFGTRGGDGGNPSGLAAGGGVAGGALAMSPAGLRGGCRGNDGSATTGSPATGGDGGGAVALIAAMQIQVDASINASALVVRPGRRALPTAGVAAVRAA